MYNIIMPYEQFVSLDTADKKRYLAEYRNRFTNKDIISSWKIGANTFYKIVSDLNLPRVRVSKSITPNEGVVSKVPQPKEPPVVEIQGFAFGLKGEQTSEKLSKRLEKLALILSDEDSKYYVDIRIKEIV